MDAKATTHLAQNLDDGLVGLSVARLGGHADFHGLVGDRGHAFADFAGARFDVALEVQRALGRLFRAGNVAENSGHGCGCIAQAWGPGVDTRTAVEEDAMCRRRLPATSLFSGVCN